MTTPHAEGTTWCILHGGPADGEHLPTADHCCTRRIVIYRIAEPGRKGYELARPAVYLRDDTDQGTHEHVGMDAFEFIANVKDVPGHGLYVDPPWPDAGDEYEHRFTEEQQRALAQCLARFSKCRVVVRYGDHPLIRELYRDGWSWIEFKTKNQRNGEVAEALIVNGRSR